MSQSFDHQVAAAETDFRAKLDEGPKRLRWSTVPVQIGDKAPNIELDVASGGRTSIATFWAERPLVIMFWRHFGCGCGMDRAQRLSTERPAYAEVGANIVIVGQGEPARAVEYAREYEIVEPILCDPTYSAYEAYGVLEGTRAQLVFDAPDEYLRGEESAWLGLIESRRGAGRPLVDNPWQLPAEFVIDTTGVIRLAYRYQYCDDFPDHRVLLSAVKEAQWVVG